MSDKPNLVFDIETGPLPDDVLKERVPPFDEPPRPGKFDPVTVKLGNLKDEDKIKAKIEAAKKAHAALEAGSSFDKVAKEIAK